MIPHPAKRIVAFAHVADVERSVAFWRELGFEVRNTYANERDGRLNWAWLETPDGAAFMVSRASAPVDAGAQAVLFYLYVPDVRAWHARWRAAGLPVGPIETPEHSPRGEFRLTDPDGYALYLREED
jgi:catechol 2,3-dioxygenase-like lactoylglutathione lyase family enzyme